MLNVVDDGMGNEWSESLFNEYKVGYCVYSFQFNPPITWPKTAFLANTVVPSRSHRTF